MPNKDEIVAFWKKGADDALKISASLYKKKYYDHALFYGHLALEKLLKASVIERVDRHPPHSHDLLYISGIAQIDVDIDRQQILKEITEFNIDGRYPEEKLEFHIRITKPYATKWLKNINEMYVWLKKQMT